MVLEGSFCNHCPTSFRRVQRFALATLALSLTTDANAIPFNRYRILDGSLMMMNVNGYHVLLLPWYAIMMVSMVSHLGRLILLVRRRSPTRSIPPHRLDPD
jgi:hypothetical protein